MVVNDDAGCLKPRCDLGSIASKLSSYNRVVVFEMSQVRPICQSIWPE
jgi:hypothetical protein